MRRREIYGIATTVLALAAMIAFRAVYIEPRGWSTLCMSAAPPLACIPRTAILTMQRFHAWGYGAMALGLLAFLFATPFAVCWLAVIFGVAGLEYYNTTWGVVGAALGAWAWLRAPNAAAR